MTKYPLTNITILNNGIRIATEKSMNNNLSATVGVYIDTGSRFESKKDNGISHFLEHLAFKGTNNRTQKQIECEIENLGGHLNAFTSREMTCYYAQVMKNDIPQAVDILSDILLNSKYEEGAVNRERSTILQEMEHVYQDSKEELIFDHLHETAFKDNSLGFTILGPVENIKKINSKMLKNYVKTHYTGNRIVIAGAGAINHQSLVKIAQEKFGGIPRYNLKQNIKKTPANFSGSDFEEHWDEMDRSYYAMAYSTPGWNHPDAVPLMFFQQLIGEWDLSMGSAQNSPSTLARLYYSNPNDPQVDKYFAFNTLYNEIGLFGIYILSHPLRIQENILLARYAINSIGNTVSSYELEFTRSKLKSNALFSLDNTSQIAEDIGRQILTYDRRIHPTELLARIDEVNIVSLQMAIHRYFIDCSHVSVALGSIYQIPEYKNLRIRSCDIEDYKISLSSF